MTLRPEDLQRWETPQIGVIGRRPFRSSGKSAIRTVSLLVPTYNESKNLPELLLKVQEALETRFDYEIIIADDDSPDSTADRARTLAAALSLPLRVIERKGSRSLALSVIGAAKVARNPCVVVLDADLSHDPSDIPLLANAVLEGRCDVAVASRYSKGGEIGRWPRYRRLLSSLGTRLARFLTAIDDPLSGYFACTRELLANGNNLRPRGYKLLLELLGRNPDLVIMEFPTSFKDRLKGASKLRFRQKMQFLLQLLSLFLFRVQTRFRSFKFKARPLVTREQGGAPRGWR